MVNIKLWIVLYIITCSPAECQEVEWNLRIDKNINHWVQALISYKKWDWNHDDEPIYFTGLFSSCQFDKVDVGNVQEGRAAISRALAPRQVFVCGVSKQVTCGLFLNSGSYRYIYLRVSPEIYLIRRTIMV